MTISIGRIFGALLAVIIFFILVTLGLDLLASFGLLIHPAISLIVWAAYAIFVCLAIAWACGITIPFINISG